MLLLFFSNITIRQLNLKKQDVNENTAKQCFHVETIGVIKGFRVIITVGLRVVLALSS